MQQRVNPAGNIERRPVNPVVDLGYLVTAWATERRDEHELLGSVLECVLSHRSLPEEFLPERFSGARCGLSLAGADRRVPGDFWSALEGRLKPGLQLQVALPIEVFEWQPTARPAEQLELTVERSGKRAANAAVGRARAGAASAGAAPNDSTQSPDGSAETRRVNSPAPQRGRL